MYLWRKLRDKNRVDIAKNEIEDISGGYILKVDRPPELDRVTV